MLLGFTNPDNDTNDFHQRVADQNIQSLEDRQEEIRHAKNGFIGMLAGIVVGGVVGWLFLGLIFALRRICRNLLLKTHCLRRKPWTV
jgi:predicted lipid-binding transport protein (Tim44 family)